MRAHHGSLAHDKRKEIEEALAKGELRAIVATSSLELGIDMAAVELVLLVESPGAVSRGLQRIGRAGHAVGATSCGVVFPKHRGDLLEAAVVAKGMREGAVESIEIPRHPLDVLAQQIVAVVDKLSFDANGLIPAIAQQFDMGEVLMMAWMNKESVTETLRTGRVCYWSRSRGKLWRKGESSGQVQTLKDFRWDCDADTVLMQVHQEGVACHTGRRNCFYLAVRDDAVVEIADVEINPDELYG